MLRTLACTAAVAAVLGTSVPASDARPRPRQGSDFVANKTFGLGIMLGAPTGLSGKYFVSRSGAIDFGVGAYYSPRRDGLHLHADYLWHPVSLVETPDFMLPLYFGLGGRFLDHDDHAHVGLRAPIGISFDFTKVPLDAFLEFGLVLDFLVDAGDDFDADLGAAIGVRYYFN